ncbi:alpha/beta hydrolase [Streptomyces marianii]|uniref:Alpha/beta hydrolase n=1 Tax=Streptomyces marianii TaxID=1817406 RepID=A0A5R9E2B5_9ACTN|nr:alpha/beta hydrolase [Streptomyces marianii]TLQ43149.1 alpha/beta hydrolase [Streptomyces marianii]
MFSGIFRLLACTTAAITTVALCPTVASASVSIALPASELHWQSCKELTGAPVDPAVADCATHHVPRGYARPSAGSVEIVMLRRRATDPDSRRGTLFVNPGGPGTSGLHTAYRAERFLDAEVLARYDVIGFDPRGVNLSDPLKCFRSQTEHDDTLRGAMAVPVTEDEIAGAMRAADGHSAACARVAGPLLPHMTTFNAAQDLEQLRRATRERQISFIGFSYGSLLGATYANLHPDHLDAMVLDGAVDPRLRSHNGLEYDRQRAIGMEIALAEFLRACEEAGTACAFSGGDPRRKFDRVRERLRGGPLALPDGTTMTLSAFTTRVADSLATPSRLPGLARALALLETAPPAPRTDSTAAVAAGGPYRGDDSEAAYNCLDKPYPAAVGTWPARADRWERQAPTFGRMVAFESAVCATWPVRSYEADRYTGPWNRETDQPVLVIGNRYDPTTQYRFAERLTDQLGRAELVTVDMIGHTALGLSRCADDITTDYLLGRGSPGHGTECRPDAGPFAG